MAIHLVAIPSLLVGHGCVPLARCAARMATPELTPQTELKLTPTLVEWGVDSELWGATRNKQARLDPPTPVVCGSHTHTHTHVYACTAEGAPIARHRCLPTCVHVTPWAALHCTAALHALCISAAHALHAPCRCCWTSLPPATRRRCASASSSSSGLSRPATRAPTTGAPSTILEYYYHSRVPPWQV